MEFQIGERIKVKEARNLLEAESRLFNSRTSRRSGMTGQIVDRLYSEANGCYVYNVLFDGESVPSRCKFTEDEIEYEEYLVKEIKFEVCRKGDSMWVTRYEDGEAMDCAYGHILHDNTIGITQAVSHAMRTMYKKLKGEI